MNNLSQNENMAFNNTSEELPRRIMMVLYRHPEIQVSELGKIISSKSSDLDTALKILEKSRLINRLNSKDTLEKAVSLREKERCVIGIDLGGTKLYGAVSDITGNILLEKKIIHQITSGDECLDMITGLIETLCSEIQYSSTDLLGIGVAVPGRVQLETGVVLNAPAVGMTDFPLKERLLSIFGYPIFIDNDLKQASLGESWFGDGKNFQHVVLLAIGTGIAASLVIDGQPLRGAHERLGELGWMVPGRDFLGRKYEGFGALETEASGPGIESRAKKHLLGAWNGISSRDIDAEFVFRAAKEGQPWAQQSVSETIEYLALLIANIMAFYDPDIIILNGGVSRSSNMLISPILKLVEGCVLTQPQLVESTLGYKAGALGAIINLIQNSPEIFL